MKLTPIAVLLATSATIATPAMAGTWQLSQISTVCSLSTQLGERMVVIMHERDTQSPDSGTLNIAFRSPALNSKSASDAGAATVRQGPPVRLEFDTGEALEDSPLIVGNDDPTMVMFKSDHIQRELDIVGEAARVRVTTDGRTDEFDLTGLRAAMLSLIDCAKSKRQ